MKIFLWAYLAVVFSLTASCLSLGLSPREKSERELRTRIKLELDRMLGRETRHYSLSLRDDVSGFRVRIDSRRSYASASTMKIAVMMAVYRLAQRGDLSLDERIYVHNSFYSVVDGSPYNVPPETLRACPYRTYKRLGDTMSLRELCRDMIQSSSNLATNLLIERVGTERIQRELEIMEIRGTRIIRGLYDELAFDRDWHNKLTARSVEDTLYALRRPDLFGRELRQEMLMVMANTCRKHRDRIPAYLPPGSLVAQKGGTTDDVLHDAGLVYPERQKPFILVILTEGYSSRGQVDDRIAFVSRYLFDLIVDLRRQRAAELRRAASAVP